MVKITYYDGRVVKLQDADDNPEFRLVIACYNDNIDSVKHVIASHPEVDVNAEVIYSNTKGNGTPLILAGTKEIGKILLENGADVNVVYDTGSVKITALDSAYKELRRKKAITKDSVQHEQVEEFIVLLKENGGKKYDDLKEEMK